MSKTRSASGVYCRLPDASFFLWIVELRLPHRGLRRRIYSHKNVIKRNQNSPTDSISEINSGDLILKNQSQISNKFNEYFTSIESTLASKIPQIDGNHLAFIKNDINNTVFLNPNNELELKRIVNDLFLASTKVLDMMIYFPK